MTYLEPIQKAGFRLHLEDGKLMVEPFSKLTDRQRAFLKHHKAEIIRELLAANNGTDRLAIRPCPTCGTDTLHQYIEGQWRCTRQHPTTMAEALQQACQRLTVTPDQVRDAMSAEDLADWEARRIPLTTLAAFARAMDTRLHGQAAPPNPPGNPLLVECWTPAGDRMLIRAEDEAQAEWLRRMNPRPKAKP